MRLFGKNKSSRLSVGSVQIVKTKKIAMNIKKVVMKENIKITQNTYIMKNSFILIEVLQEQSLQDQNLIECYLTQD